MKKFLFIALLIGAFSLCANKSNAALVNVFTVEQAYDANATGENKAELMPVINNTSEAIVEEEALKDYEVTCTLHTYYFMIFDSDGNVVDIGVFRRMECV